MAPDHHTTATTAGTRLVVIDALRCLAVLLVLGRHLERPTLDVAPALGAMLSCWKRIGWIGVDLFFVLSGFLVAGLLLVELQRHGNLQVVRFLGRRGFKIYPGFYALLLVSAWWLGDSRPVAAFWHEALFVQNYLEPVIWNHTWSLAVEEHFYIVLALVLGLAVRRPGAAVLGSLPLVVAFVGGTVLLMRIVVWLQQPSVHLLFPTHLRLDALACGVGLAYGWHCHREAMEAWIVARRRRLLLAAGVLLMPSLTLTVEHSAVINTIGLTANYLAFGALLMVALTSGEWAQWRSVRWLAKLGFYSYSMYLWHMPVLVAVRSMVAPRIGHGPGMLVYLIGSLVVGVVMARLIELPFLRLRDRLLPARKRPVAPAAARAA